MTDKLLLHNTLSYYGHSKDSDLSHLICCDDGNYTRISRAVISCPGKTAEKIMSAFDSGVSLVALTGKPASGKSTLLREFAKISGEKFDCVIYTEYDGDKYIFGNDESFRLDESYILEKSITSIFSAQVFRRNNPKSPYLRKSSRELLFDLSDRNTLIIIDNYNPKTVPDFLQLLLHKGFSVLLCCRDGACLPKNTVVIKQEKYTLLRLKAIYGLKVSDAVFKEFCTVTGFSPMAVNFAKYFVQSGDFSLKDITASIKRLSLEKSINPQSDFIKLFYFLADFSIGEKEALRTLAVLLSYRHPMLKSSMDKDGIFTKAHVSSLISKPAEKLSRLINYGFIGELSDGSLYMENAIARFVLDFLKPTSANCPAFMGYLKRKTDFLLSQSAKNLSFNFMTEPCSANCDCTFYPELYDAYAYFINNENGFDRELYNLLMMYALRAKYDNRHSLFLRSRLFYLSVIQRVTKSSYAVSQYYLADDYFLYSPAHTPHIMGLLDTLRVCVVLIRNLPCENYPEYCCVFRLMKDTFKQIVKAVEEKYHNENTFSVYCDVIRICEEAFFYFNNLSYSGNVHSERCCENAVIGYTDEVQVNEQKAVSVYPLYSTDVFLLYTQFFAVARRFTQLSRELVLPKEQYYSLELILRTKDFCREFSSFYFRVKRGFDVFYDFYDKKYTDVDVKSSLSRFSRDKIGSMLEKAKQISPTYCKDSTEDCKRYAESIIKTLKRGDNFLTLFRLVTHRDYPISKKCLEYLLQNGITKLLCGKGADDLRTITEVCADSLAACDEKANFYVVILSDLLLSYKKLRCNDRIFTGICTSLIVRACNILGENGKGVTNLISSLTEDSIFRLFSGFIRYIPKVHTSEMCIAFCLYRLAYKKQIPYSDTELKEALMSIVYEHMPLLNPIGFAKMTALLCTKADGIQIINEMLSVDICNRITKHQYQAISKTILKIKQGKVKTIEH